MGGKREKGRWKRGGDEGEGDSFAGMGGGGRGRDWCHLEYSQITLQTVTQQNGVCRDQSQHLPLHLLQSGGH